MAKTYAQCLRDYNRKVLQSAIGSVAAVSPPSSYKAAKNAKDSSNAQKTKDAIKRLQARIYGSWNEIVQGFPAGKSKIYSPSKEYPYNHLFVLGKGKGVRA